MRNVTVSLAIGFIILLSFATCVPRSSYTPYDGAAEDVYPGAVWQKAVTPEQCGWSSDKLAVARTYAEQIGSAAVMIVDDGVVVAAWGDVARRYQCHSMRKSLLSALVGIHVHERHLDLARTLAELGIDDTEPALTATEKQATVADLIQARSGVYHPALCEAASMKAKRPQRGSHAPGTFWYYNNWDFNALGTIFEQETGTRIFDEFTRRLAGPLQMEDFAVEDCRYVHGADSLHPCYHFHMSTRDLARFGLLYLREGRWRDQQIVPASWVRESTTAHSQTGPDSGYGYMWWTGVAEGLFPHVRVKEHSFYASGYRGHRVIVLPYRNLVVVHRVDTDDGDAAISDRQIGRLLWLVLDAAGETSIGEPPFIEAAPGLRITGANYWRELFAGATIRIPDSAGVALYRPDGTMTYLDESGAVRDTGTWWFAGDRFCRQWHELDGGAEVCLYVVLDGTTLQLFALDGTLVERVHFSRDVQLQR